jgi:hypothetical protein
MPIVTSQPPRCFILGAGFSAAAGLPLTTGLLDLVLEEIAGLNDGDSHLHQSLEEYRNFVRETSGREPDSIDIEEFATYLDHQHTFGMLGTDTWSEDGNRDQFLLRWGIGRILNSSTPSTGALPDLYRRFADQLRPRDTIITFNYDLLLERSLESAGHRYRRFPDRSTDVGEVRTIDREAEAAEIVVLKMHGSLDWVDRQSFDRNREYWATFGNDVAEISAARDLMFGDRPVSPSRPLTDGGGAARDPLATLVVVEDCDACYSSFQVAYHHPPVILAPSQAKQLYGRAVREFWQGLTRWGNAWSGLSIIGYSLPPADPYALQTIYGLARGYCLGLDDPGYRLGDMRRIVLVDKRTDDPSRQALKDRYRFLPLHHTDMAFDGFDYDAIRLVTQAPSYIRTST